MEPIFNAVTTQSFMFLTGLTCGIFLYMFFSNSKGSKNGTTSAENSQEDSEYSFSDSSAGTKMTLVVRNDLKMGKGKAAAQCAHAAVMAHEIAKEKKPDMLKKWKQSGQKKIVVKAENEEELLQLASEAKKLGLIYAIVKDAGLTQIRSGTKTVLALGPEPEKLVDKITSHLKLY